MSLIVEEKNNILIYEKEIKLNQILKEQISRSKNLNIYSISEEKKLPEIFQLVKVNSLILNLNHLNENLITSIKSYINSDRIFSILGYYKKNHIFLDIEKIKVKYFIKPFKIIDLVNDIEKFLNLEISNKSNILLSNNLKFLPYERVLLNLKTKNREYLTEKENKLLFYLYNNQSVKITKNDLLSAVWGISANINTHTLETHVYRLKQKLSKVDRNSLFLLSNKNSVYTIQFEKK